MDWFLYDNGLFHERVKPFQTSVTFHIETSSLIYDGTNKWFLYEMQHLADMG